MIEVNRQGEVWVYAEQEDGTLSLWDRRVARNWSWMENRRITVTDGERREMRSSHRIYSAVELASLLETVGFTVRDVFGHLDGRPYDHEARRLVVVAERPE